MTERVFGVGDEPDVDSLKDELIRDALIAGMSYPDAAEEARVSSRTVRRRMADEGFRAQVRAGIAERMAQQSARLSGLGGKAIAALDELLDDENSVVRDRAVRTALTLGHQFRREVELIERIEDLERKLHDALGRPETEGEDDVVV